MNSTQAAGCTFLSSNFFFPFLHEAFTFPKPRDMATVSSSSGLKRKAPPGAEDEVKTNKRPKGDISKYFLPINRGKGKESENHSASPERELSSTSNDTVATIPLETLLDFDNLVSEDDICARFEAIARALFFHYRIRIINPESENTTHHLELLEIEFYLIKPGHADPYCHASAEQDVAGRWYVSSPVSTLTSPLNSTSGISTAYLNGATKMLPRERCPRPLSRVNTAVALAKGLI